jgi:pyruvate/2-oxoglutarate dehydrogenase complex dihydrolipoamide dehydrogenase (E3) component
MVECEYLIIGGGDTGVSLAESLNKLNVSIALVEAHKLGGGTLNNVIVPKKEFYKEIKNFVHAANYFTDQDKMTDRLCEVQEIVSDKINKNINKKYNAFFDKTSSLSSLKILFGNATPLTKNTINIDLNGKNLIVKFKKCLLCIGRDFVDPQYINGIENINYLTKYTVYFINEIPTKLAIIGLTHESLEVASFYSQLGIEVNIYEQKSKSQILPSIDRTMASYLINKVLFNYVNIYFETQISQVSDQGEYINLRSQNQKLFQASHLYIHLDEKFDPSQAMIKKLRLKSTQDGIRVDANSKTNISNIYAFGSCTNKYESKKIVRAKIEQFADQEKRKHENKHRKLSTQLILNTANIISYKPQQENIGRLVTFEIGYFLDSIGVGLSEVQAVGKYGPKVRVVLIANKQQSEFVKVIYFVSSKRLLGYWATSYFKTHFHSLLSFAIISRSNTLSVIDVIQSHLGDFEKKVS